MSTKKEAFQIDLTRKERLSSVERLEQFIHEQEPETQLAVRIPSRLCTALKIHAVQTGQTQKQIITRLIAEYLERHAAS
jgi:hypothetical protein